jgi:hypothetical protein
MPSISDTLLLPGQPIPLPARAPAPQLGHGIYERNGQLRASLLGIPHFEGSVRTAFSEFAGQSLSLYFVDFGDITNQILPPLSWRHCYWFCYATFTVASIDIDYYC